MNMEPLLNKPYTNEVTLTGQNPHLTLFPMAHFPTYSLWGWVINVSVIALKLMKICRNKTSQVSQKPTKTEVSI